MSWLTFLAFLKVIVTGKQMSMVILGCGYVGQFVYRRAIAAGRSVFATSRGLHDSPPDYPDNAYRLFDLARPDTWENLPEEAESLWCFPAAPLELVQRFGERLLASHCRLVVLGSTSAYDLPNSAGDYPPPWFDETAPLDLTKPRVQGEEHLRKELGAIVLRVAGIYGPGRSPVDWIKTGRVSPSRKYVNLIHVEDLAAICLAALERGKPGEAYNVSDGIPRTWEEIYENVSEQLTSVASEAGIGQQPGKRISIGKLRESFGPIVRHHDLYAELVKIASQ